jgi:DNA-binding NtrC family response regulator
MEYRGTILVIDDEEDMLENCRLILGRFGHQIIICQDSRKVSKLIREHRPQVILSDLRMPYLDGMSLLQLVKEEHPEQLVILFTAYATVQSAVQAVQEGAYDYLPKPFTADQLNLVIQRALQQIKLAEENYNLKAQLERSYNFKDIIGSSKAMDIIFKLVEKIAKSEANILIAGESGTGKEMMARCIHANSNRATKPFVPIDCASIPENLMESELFGHEKGAFTGAQEIKQGLFEVADGGTLFLDEIGELSQSLQAKLLRVLQEQQLRRVGGVRLINVNVRILAATNRDLQQLIRQKEFREDLYYRINVVKVALPPLRERREDIPLLSTDFCRQFARQNDRPDLRIAKDTMAALVKYPWPGNVRELKNVIERAVILAEGEQITPEDLPDFLGSGGRDELMDMPDNLPFHEAKEYWIKKFEQKYLFRLIELHRGNISQAAREAGVDRKTIHRLLKKHSPRE